MVISAKRILCLIFIFGFALPLYAGQALPDQGQKQAPKEAEKIALPRKQPLQIRSFWDFLNSKAYAFTIDKREEEKRLREEWQKLLGLDIFYPYYVAKEIEEWVKDKGRVEVFNLRGRPEFDKNQARYMFRVRF